MRIAVSKGIKAGVGKFETVDINTIIEFEIDANEHESNAINDAYARAYSIVDEQLNKQIEEIQGMLKADSVFILEKPKPTSAPEKSRERPKGRRP